MLWTRAAGVASFCFAGACLEDFSGIPSGSLTLAENLVPHVVLSSWIRIWIALPYLSALRFCSAASDVDSNVSQSALLEITWCFYVKSLQGKWFLSSRDLQGWQCLPRIALNIYSGTALAHLRSDMVLLAAWQRQTAWTGHAFQFPANGGLRQRSTPFASLYLSSSSASWWRN